MILLRETLVSYFHRLQMVIIKQTILDMAQNRKSNSSSISRKKKSRSITGSLNPVEQHSYNYQINPVLYQVNPTIIVPGPTQNQLEIESGFKRKKMPFVLNVEVHEDVDEYISYDQEQKVLKPRRIIKSCKIQLHFDFLVSKYQYDIKKIEYSKKLKFLKFDLINLSKSQNVSKLIQNLNQFLRASDYNGVLDTILAHNNILQSDYKIGRSQFGVYFLLKGDIILHIESKVSDSTKKVNCLTSLVIIRLIAKEIYKLCETGQLLFFSDFNNVSEMDRN